jgi:hypothetical protein
VPMSTTATTSQAGKAPGRTPPLPVLRATIRGSSGP